ncbi:TonB-dependent receptor [Sphingobacterium sp. LRF_L2]|uniref:TonB-dependent receptor n=1 Tax=Sphingobacterium sp. LRF_L2 TaxID=3369421 RepID=UPI003F63F521
MIFIQQNDDGSKTACLKIKRWVILMKLTILLTVLSFFKLTAGGFAQQVSLKAVNSPLVQVMQSIQKQSGMPFLLNGKDIASTKLTVDLKHVPLEKALTTLLANQPISWEISEGTIILRRTGKANPSIESTAVKQQRIVKGTVSDEQGKPIQGASIKILGTTQGTSTDATGSFSLSVESRNAVLQVSYIGFISSEINIGDQQTVKITLKADAGDLDEVVVVGYGTQKKKLTTGASIQVKGEDLQKLSSPSILESLQSQSPGVQITQSSGMPGESFKVTIRGLGTIGSSSPLYVIDGVPNGDINMLNPSDIESIDILKDAASAAIYGSRAANGVVLITTKQGKEGKMAVHLDSYLGFQNAYKLPSLLTAKEYMAIQDERRFNEGAEPYDWANLIPKQYEQIMNGTWNGTNWLKEIHNDNAILQNTSINMMGGTEMSRFSIGYSITDRDGIMGVPAEPNFKRHTARINSEHILLKNDEYNIIKFGENVNYGTTKRSGIGIGNIYWNDIHNMLVGNPLLPVYNENGEFYDRASKTADQWNFDGATANPIAEMYYRRGQNLSKAHNLSVNAYLEIQPLRDLVFKTNFGYRLNASSYRQYTPVYNLSTTVANAVDEISQNQELGHSLLWENTLSYKLAPASGHQLDMVIGQSIEKNGLGENLSVTTANSSFPGEWDKAWVGNGQGYEGYIPTVGGSHLPLFSIASFFGRANYNINETYIASFTLRADGSSNFAKGNRWGYFPSASAGWIMTNEEFLKDNGWLNFMKLRGSWGQNGNANIDPFQYLATVAIDVKNGYYFGNNKNTLIRGAYPDILANPDISWETSEQLNIGFDSRFVDNKLSVVFDWYRKTTKDWLVQAPVLAIYGTSAPYINGGDVENKGIEFGVNWNDTKGNFRYGIGINGAYNKNKVLRIANDEGIIHGATDVLSQGTKEMYRAQEGYPIGYFYGFKTDGIFQTQEQIDALRASGLGVLSNAQPGDVIFRDTNGDGAITDDDKVMIGNPHPDFSGGLNLNAGYKGIDLSVTAIGSFGHQIAKSYRSFADSPLQNYTTEIFDRWHGEGTSNKLPRLTSGSHTNSQYISDIYVENGDFVKIQNVTLGYDLKTIWKNMPFSQLRFYATVQNLITFTKYSGMDPEIGYGYDESWVSGIDLGFYPQPRTVMFGLNLKF